MTLNTWFSNLLNSTKHPSLQCRLEPVIIELERQRAPVVVISHQVYIILNLCLYCFFFFWFMILLNFDIALFLQAVLRALYAYFADRPLKEIPHIEVIWHVASLLQFSWRVLCISCAYILGQEGKGCWYFTTIDILIRILHPYCSHLLSHLSQIWVLVNNKLL